MAGDRPRMQCWVACWRYSLVIRNSSAHFCPPAELLALEFRLFMVVSSRDEVGFLAESVSESLLRQRRLDMALIFARTARDNLLQVADSGNGLLATYKRMGTIYRSMGQYDKSERSFQDAMRYCVEPDERPNVLRQLAETQKEMATAKSSTSVGSDSVFDTPLATVDQALDLLAPLTDNYPGNASFACSLAYALTTKANILIEMKRIEEARSLIEKAIEFHVSAVGPDHQFVGFDYRYLGKAMMMAKRFDEALEYFGKSLSIYENFYGRDSADAMDVVIRMSEAYTKLGRIDDALESADRAVRAFQRYEISAPGYYSRALKNRGKIQARRGVVADAVADFSKALEIETRLQNDRRIMELNEWIQKLKGGNNPFS